jgi:regulator of replication initiation timing
MAYRDDYDALLARLEAVLEENRRLQAENDDLRRRLTGPPPKPQHTLTCPKCFHANPTNVRFCEACGERIAAD